MAILSRTILAPWDILADTAQAQHLALMFDRLLLWRLYRQEPKAGEHVRLDAEAEFLASQQIVARIGIDPAVSPLPRGALTRNCEIVLPLELAVGKTPPFAQHLSPVDKVLRTVASRLQVHDAPVAVHMESSAFPGSADDQPLLEVIIDKVPMPPVGLPWQDLIQFKKDAENVQLLRKLRLWVQERAIAKKPIAHVAEELEAMLDDYRKYMQIQHRKYSVGTISTLVIAGLEQIADLTSGSFAKTAVQTVFRIAERRILLAEAELRAPGREVAYIAKVSDLAP